MPEVIYESSPGVSAKIKYCKSGDRWYGASDVSLKWSGYGEPLSAESYDKPFKSEQECIDYHLSQAIGYIERQIADVYSGDSAKELLKYIRVESRQGKLGI